MGQNPGSVTSNSRVVAIDVFRGLVLVLLLPDTHGGFGLYALSPDVVERWHLSALVAQFWHVEWQGCALWDLVFPSFAFVIGASLWYSYRARVAAGASSPQLWRHALFRSFVLVLLGIMSMVPVTTHLDEIALIVVLVGGFPIAGWLGRLRGRDFNPEEKRRVETLIWILAISWAFVWLAMNRQAFGERDLDRVTGEVLVMLGLAYISCFAFVARSLATQAAAAALIVLGYGLMFVLFPLPLPSGHEAVSSVAPMWTNGLNASARFDLWLHNLYPRTTTFVLDPHGYHTLQFIGLVPIMLTGLVAGRYLSIEPDYIRGAVRLLVAAAIGMAVALLLMALGVPLVKSIWTPSFEFFSAAICVATLASLHWCCNRWPGALWKPLVVLGSNAIFVYVIALPRDHWRLTGLLRHLTGNEWTAGGFAPVIESLWVLALLWSISWLLYRNKVFIRL